MNGKIVFAEIFDTDDIDFSNSESSLITLSFSDAGLESVAFTASLSSDGLCSVSFAMLLFVVVVIGSSGFRLQA